MIFEGTRSSFKVKILNKVIKIHGELLSNGFVAYKNSISNWEPPYESEVVSDEEKNMIIKHVLEESQMKNLGIYFE